MGGAGSGVKRSPGRKLKGGGGVSLAAAASEAGAAEETVRVMREAWAAVGGGELVRLPVNPFDFRTRLRKDASGQVDLTAALVSQVCK